jgi:hypothetical protein
MKLFRCELCQKDFQSEDALAMHTQAKHFSPQKKSLKVNKKFLFLLAVIIVAGLFIWLVMATLGEAQECKTAPVETLFITDHSETKSHYHADLEIIIDGKKQEIPVDIGVENELMRAVHTHDASGELHIEGPCIRDYTLGDFFTIWGKQFTSQCVFEFCTDKGILKMTVNGEENIEFEQLLLQDGQKIVIEYVKR